MGIQSTASDDNATFNVDEPIILPRTRLTLEDLPILGTVGHVNQDESVTIDRSAKGTRLKTPVTFPLDRILSLEKGVAEYVISSLIKTKPRLLPWTLANETLVNLASHLLRAGTGSQDSCYAYINDVSLHVRWLKLLGESADRLISDVKKEPGRLENHKAFLAKHLAAMQDRDLAPGRLKGFARHVRTFYHTNDVELPKPKTMPMVRVVNKDDAPSQEQLQTLIDIGDLREKVIVSMLALTGVRESTLALLRYGDLKEDFEANKIPVCVRINLEITKGHYASFRTFLGEEGAYYFRLYLDQRRKGTRPQQRNGEPIKYVPPEEIVDNSPIIASACSSKPIGKKNIYQIMHRLYHRAGLLSKKNNPRGRHYDLRTHSIRKFFDTQMIARNVQESYVQYWMGHVVDSYNDVDKLPTEFLREVYAKADHRIRSRAQYNKLEMAKEVVGEILRGMGLNLEDLVKSYPTVEPHRTLANQEAGDEQQLQLYLTTLVDTIRRKSLALPQTPPPTS